MKKFVASIAAAFLLLGGLVAFSGASATAAPAYPPTVKTKVIIKTPKANQGKSYKVREKIRLWVEVKTAGTAKPKGKVTLYYQRKSGGKWKTVTKKQKNNKQATRNYNGKGKRMSIGFAKKPGNYRVRVVFSPVANSVFKTSTKTLRFKVR